MPRQRGQLIRRGDVIDADIPGVGIHPVVVVTRDTAIPVLSAVVCVLVTSRFHGHVAEVALGGDEGLDHECAANCDNLFTLPTSVLRRRRGRLSSAQIAKLDAALKVALDLS
jgi:mRNA interferase MazF